MRATNMGAKRRLALGGLLTAIALAGCDDEPEVAPRKVAGPAREVARVVDRLDRSVRAGDFDVVCRRLLTPVARERAGGRRCAAAMAASVEDVRRPRIRLRSIRIVGDRAEASIRTTASGQKPIDETLELVRGRDGYRIVALDR